MKQGNSKVKKCGTLCELCLCSSFFLIYEGLQFTLYSNNLQLSIFQYSVNFTIFFQKSVSIFHSNNFLYKCITLCFNHFSQLLTSFEFFLYFIESVCFFVTHTNRKSFKTFHTFSWYDFDTVKSAIS